MLHSLAHARSSWSGGNTAVLGRVPRDLAGQARASPGQAPSLAGQAISALSLVEHFLKIEGGPARASPGKLAAWPEPGQSSQNANLEAKQCEKKEATRL